MNTERKRDVLDKFGITWEDFLYLSKIFEEDIKASETEKKQKLEVRITKLLREMCIPAHLNGYMYLKNAIEICYNYNVLPLCITKVVYPNIAEIYDTIPSRVERNIRHAIEVAWKYADLEKISHIFGSTVSSNRRRPTNLEFLNIVTEYLKLEDKM